MDREWAAQCSAVRRRGDQRGEANGSCRRVELDGVSTPHLFYCCRRPLLFFFCVRCLAVLFVVLLFVSSSPQLQSLRNLCFLRSRAKQIPVDHSGPDNTTHKQTNATPTAQHKQEKGKGNRRGGYLHFNFCPVPADVHEMSIRALNIAHWPGGGVPVEIPLPKDQLDTRCASLALSIATVPGIGVMRDGTLFPLQTVCFSG